MKKIASKSTLKIKVFSFTNLATLLLEYVPYTEMR